MKSSLLSYAGLGLTLLFGSQAHALTCDAGVQFAKSSSKTWPKSAVFIGRDLPTGWMISNGVDGFTLPTGTSAKCTGTPGEQLVPSITLVSPYPLSTYSGGALAAGDGKTYPLYQIAPGLAYGLAFTPSVTPVLDSSGIYAPTQSTGTVSYSVSRPVIITDRAALVPGAYDVSGVVAYVTLGGQTAQYSTTGTITISQGTCQTPDVSVDLGTHGGNEFNGVGTGTNWTNFAISLLNCPAFSGPGVQGYNPQGLNLYAATNTIGVTFTPTTSAIGAPTAGTIALSVNPSGLTASGIGIQIADASSHVPVVIDGATVNLPFNPPQSSAAGTTYTIPLAARYIQTDDRLAGGKANGSLYFTINYQ